MSSANIDITATDSASSVIDGIAASTQALGTTAATTSDSNASLVDTFQASARVGGSAMIALDRIQISMDAVSNAQNRQELATMRVTDAIQKYGAGSQQAQMANLELENSHRSLEIAQEREQVRMVYGSLVAIPGMIKGLQSLGETLDFAALKEDLFTGTIDANTAAQLANIAVATLGVGVPIALMAMTFAESQSPQNTNIYGNVNVNGASASTINGIASTAAYGSP
jgi:hypothetical protein